MQIRQKVAHPFHGAHRRLILQRGSLSHHDPYRLVRLAAQNDVNNDMSGVMGKIIEKYDAQCNEDEDIQNGGPAIWGSLSLEDKFDPGCMQAITWEAIPGRYLRRLWLANNKQDHKAGRARSFLDILLDC